jgi:hypothetical protein
VEPARFSHAPQPNAMDSSSVAQTKLLGEGVAFMPSSFRCKGRIGLPAQSARVAAYREMR